MQLDIFDMEGGAITLVYLKTILRKSQGELFHLPVTPHLCQNRGVGDDRHRGITPDDGLLVLKCFRGLDTPIKEDKRDLSLEPKTRENLPDALPYGPDNAIAVNYPRPNKGNGVPDFSGPS